MWEWLLPILGNVAGGWMSGGGGYDPNIETGGGPMDTFSQGQRALGPESSQEAHMAQLQQMLAGRSMSTAMAGGTGGISQWDLARGNINPTMQGRIDDMAYGGLNEGFQRALSAAENRAGSRGIFGSSVQDSMSQAMMRPMIEGASQQRAGLMQSEMGRQQGLYQQGMQNMMAAQNQGALQRLMQIRLAEATTQQGQMQREPGDMPDWVAELLKWGNTQSNNNANANDGSGGNGGSGGTQIWDDEHPANVNPNFPGGSGPVWPDPGGDGYIDVGGRHYRG